MLINFDQLFAGNGDLVITKMPIAIPNLFVCRSGIKLKGVKIGSVDLTTLRGKTVEVLDVDGVLTIENFFPYLIDGNEPLDDR